MSEITVLGKVYAIQIQSSGSSDLRDNVGTAFNLEGRIVISSDLSEEERISTLIHEALEVICYQLGISGGEERERMVRQLEVGLYTFFKSNLPQGYAELGTLLEARDETE